MSDSVVGLDIGTSYVRAVIGEFNEDGELQITGVGVVPSSGLNHGLVVNIEATYRAVKKAIEEAEMMCTMVVHSFVCGIGGSQIDSLNSSGVVAVANRETREITQEDVLRAIDSARAVPVPPDRQVLHVVPQGYTIDGQSGYMNPVDMIGVRLGVDVLIVTAAITSLKNVMRVAERAEYKVDSVMLKTLATVQAVTTEEERRLGSLIIDLGGGSTDAIVLIDGTPLCTATVPVGGINVTNDISYMCGIGFDTAEQIKLNSGCCSENFLERDDLVLVPGVGGRPPEEISRLAICNIIKPRMVETLTLLRDQIIAKVNHRQLMGNIVLVGGGAHMPGIIELVGEVFGTRSVRIGYPANFGGLQEEYRKPEFASAVGLVVSNRDKRHPPVGGDEPNGGGKWLENIIKRMKETLF